MYVVLLCDYVHRYITYFVRTGSVVASFPPSNRRVWCTYTQPVIGRSKKYCVGSMPCQTERTGRATTYVRRNSYFFARGSFLNFPWGGGFIFILEKVYFSLGSDRCISNESELSYLLLFVLALIYFKCQFQCLESGGVICAMGGRRRLFSLFRWTKRNAFYIITPRKPGWLCVIPLRGVYTPD